MLGIVKFAYSIMCTVAFVCFFNITKTTVSGSLARLAMLILQYSHNGKFVQRVLPRASCRGVNVMSIMSMFVTLLLGSRLTFAPKFVSLVIGKYYFVKVCYVKLILTRRLFITRVVRSVVGE